MDRRCAIVLLLAVSLKLCAATVYEEYFNDNNEKRAVGQSIDPEVQCKRIHGHSSYFCRDKYTSDYGYLCSSFYCYSPSLKACNFEIPPQASTGCGNGKWCENLMCVNSRDATVTSDECPFGDTTNPTIGTYGKSCSELIQFRPNLCLDNLVKKWCCESCHNLTSTMVKVNFTGPSLSAEKDCQKTFGNDSYFCRGAGFYGGTLDDRICQNFYCFDPSTGGCRSVIADNGVPCGDDKWCVSGTCETNSKASSDPMGDCLYGNRWQTFCKTNIKYPQVAEYCSNPDYESGCCSECANYKNVSAPANCKYGDLKPLTCKQHVDANTITGFCVSHEADCCETCSELKKTGTGDPNCPYGDTDTVACSNLMEDSLGPGNCYNAQHKKECCSTCSDYFNATRKAGCEYGDHWKDWCKLNVKPPKVSNMCASYESQCCGTCQHFKDTGFPGCTYGDRDPDKCATLMNDTLGTANCYFVVRNSECCGTCHDLKDESTPSCLYGDKDPSDCGDLEMDHTRHDECYNIRSQTKCCRTCAQLRNDTQSGCEYGDHDNSYCTNITPDSLFLCHNYGSTCCETCNRLQLSNIPACQYGDSNPYNCKFLITDASTAAAHCPAHEKDCCATCYKYGHGSSQSSGMVG